MHHWAAAYATALSTSFKEEAAKRLQAALIDKNFIVVYNLGKLHYKKQRME